MSFGEVWKLVKSLAKLKKVSLVIRQRYLKIFLYLQTPAVHFVRLCDCFNYIELQWNPRRVKGPEMYIYLSSIFHKAETFCRRIFLKVKKFVYLFWNSTE